MLRHLKCNNLNKSILLLVFLLFFVSDAWALKEWFGEWTRKKQDEKASTRWTLGDWLTQKKSFKAMDQWLALNRTIDMFELNIEGGKQDYEMEVLGVDTDYEMDRYGISFYWSIFGIEYQFEDSDEDFQRESGQFNIRLLGTSSQTTNLTAFYGVRKWSFETTPPTEVTNQYAGGKLNLYFVSFFGLEGQYKSFFADKDDNNKEYESERVDYGAFIEISFIRIYGNAFKETTKSTPAGGTTSEDIREGSEYGIKLMF